MATLPPELIVTEILPKLPAKSLLRFKCVSKSFKTLISSPEFICAHLRHSLSSTTNRRLLLINNSDKRLYSADLSTPNPAAVRLPLLQRFNGYCSFIVGSSNGVVCFLVIGETFFNYTLFNPSTGISKELRFDASHILIADAYVSFGFGYDSECDDYKLVRIVDYFKNVRYDLGVEAVRREVVVYSARTGLGRGLDEIVTPRDSVILQNMAIIDNSLVHCMFWSSMKSKHRCGCFDVCSEKWVDDVPLPDYYCGGEEKLHDVLEIGVFDGCLCLLIKNHQHSTTDVWIMKEYGLKESWTKLLDSSDSVVTRDLKVVPIAYGKGSKEEVLIQLDDRTVGLLWYDPRCKTAKMAEISGVRSVSEAFMCNDSLVSIAGGKQTKWE